MEYKDIKEFVPSDWEIIKPEYYSDYSIISVEEHKCIIAYKTPEDTDGNRYAVAFFSMAIRDIEGFFEEDFEEIRALFEDPLTLEELDEISDLKIPQIFRPDSIHPLFFGSLKNKGKELRLIILKAMKSSFPYYSVIIYFVLNNNLIECSTKVININEDYPLTVIEQYEHIDMLIRYIQKVSD